MADISVLARVLNGALRNVDLSSNALVVGSLKVGSVSPTELTKAILDRLVSLQNGTDVDATYHTHDTLYYRKTEIASTGATSGASLVGVNGTPTNYTPSANNVQKHLEAIDTALATAGSADFLDTLFRISDDGDNTKKIAFQASGISTGTVRTITMPDANVNLADANNAILVNGARAFTANQSLGGNKITNSADPTSGQDLVTLAYLNARIAGIKPKAAVRAATTVAGTLASSFENGDVIDGVTLATGDRILIKDQAAPETNGIYTVNVSGAPTRATDFDSLSPIDEINGAWTAVQEGTVNAGKIYVQFGVVATLGTDPITFEYFNPIAGLIGGDMITFAGSTFSVDLAAVSGLESSNPGNVAGQLRIKLEASNPSLQFSGSNELGVKFDPAGAISSGASGIKALVDNSTLEISSNAIRQKDAGTTAAKINANVFDQDTITGGTGSAAVVQSAPKSKESLVAGEAFASNTSFLVRWAVSGETAGRVYKADKDASVSDKFYSFGIALSAPGVSAGQSITVVKLGQHTLGSSDTPFGGTDIGKAVFLGSSGAFILGAALANTTNEAQVRIGMVRTTTTIDVAPQFMGIA